MSLAVITSKLNSRPKDVHVKWTNSPFWIQEYLESSPLNTFMEFPVKKNSSKDMWNISQCRSSNLLL